MKIERLDLKAFGCFTDVTLDFTQATHGMYILYGDNEAGKSTALAGLRQWLYEFDRLTSLDFRHRNPAQRVGGVVASHGRQLACFRKRGNKNTLLVADGKTALPETALDELLQGIDKNRFCTTFGIDHNQLVQGGQEICQGQGDLGQALFSAGSGLIQLRRIQTGLEDAAKQLFAVRGHNPVINSSLGRCRELEQKLAEAQLSVTAFEQQRRLRAETKQKRQLLSTEQSRLQQQRDELTRQAQARPIVERRSTLLEHLDELQGVVLLRGEFAKEFHDADSKFTGEKVALDELNGQLDQIDQEMNQLCEQPSLLREERRLKDLADRIGEYRKNQDDLPKIRTVRNSAEGEAKQVLRHLGRQPDLADETIEPLRLDDQTRNRIRSLGTQRGHQWTAFDTARKKALKMKSDLRAVEDELAGLPVIPDLTALAAVVERIARLGQLDEDCANATRKLRDQTAIVERELNRLPWWSGTADQAVMLAVPSPEGVDLYRDRLDGESRKHGTALDKEAQLRKRIAELNEKMSRIQGGGAVPSEKELERERARREQVWRLIRRVWQDGQPEDERAQRLVSEMAPAGNLAEAYEATVQRTDQVADRLRREAERVSDQASAQAELERTEAELSIVREEIARSEKTQRAAEDDWQALWHPLGIAARSPREMRSWRDSWERLRREVEQQQQLARDLECNKAVLTEAEQAVRTALSASGGLPPSVSPLTPLGELLEIARQRRESAEATRRRRENLEGEATRLSRDLRQSEDEEQEQDRLWKSWQGEWASAIAFLELGPETLPDDANRVIDTLIDFWKKISDVKGFRVRVEGMERSMEGFRKEVEELLARIDGPETAEAGARDPVTALQSLRGRFDQAEKDKRRLEGKQVDREDLLRRIGERKSNIAALEGRLERLRQEAQVDCLDDIPLAIHHSADRRETEGNLRECETALRQLADLVTLEDFCARVHELSGRDLQGDSAALDIGLREMGDELQNLDQTIGALSKELDNMKARSGAGDAAAELQSELAFLRRHVDEYASLVLTSRVLEEAIRRYRDRNKTGILDEASLCFAKLTCSSFERLEIGEDDSGNPILQGVRPDGASVAVSGMSDGSCDQLYLALRLANLKRHVEAHGPFPFIVDDILIAFDDQRAQAALRCLADLSQTTQVIFFTHHRRLCEMAESAEFRGRIFIQNLPTATVSLVSMVHGTTA